RSTPSPTSSSSSACVPPTASRPRTTSRHTSGEPPGSADPAYDVAGSPVLGRLLADVLLAGHPAPRRYVAARRRGGGDDAEQPTDLDVSHVPGELDDRCRADEPATVQLHH